MELWFEVSKFASTSSLVYSVEWEKASDLVRTSHETRTALGPVSMSNYTMACRPNFPTGITMRNIGLWLVTDYMICFVNPDSVAEVCVCKLCISPAGHHHHRVLDIHCQIDSSQCVAQLTQARVGIARSVHAQLGVSPHVIR